MRCEITDRDKALFETGIKLGALFHQFIGMPINQRILSIAEKAIEESIKLQPYVVDVKVKINLEEASLNAFGYCELRGEMLSVDLKVRYKSVEVSAGLRYDQKLKYPMMFIKKIREGCA